MVYALRSMPCGSPAAIPDLAWHLGGQWLPSAHSPQLRTPVPNFMFLLIELRPRAYDKGRPWIPSTKASPGPAILYRPAAPAMALWPFQGWPARRAGYLQPSSTPLGTPRRTPMTLFQTSVPQWIERHSAAAFFFLSNFPYISCQPFPSLRNAFPSPSHFLKTKSNYYRVFQMN
jgi:hypothetical protein